MNAIEKRARELLGAEYMLSLSGAGPKQRHLHACAIRAIIAALTPQWQPIESAPKDGQYILACDEDAILVTHWMEGGWYEGEDRYEYFYWEPSHWMALPARPEVKNVND